METLTKPLQSADQMHPTALYQGANNTLAKLEFEGLDPRFSDKVYHITSVAHLASIEQEGLKYSDTSDYLDFGRGRHNWFQNTEKLIASKPADIPIDFHHTVFGQLGGDKLGKGSEPGVLRSFTDRGEMLEVAVDPTETYVGDGKAREYILSGVMPQVFSGDWDASPMYPSEDAQMQDYWSNVMPLSTFRELYQPEAPQYEGDDTVAWVLKNPDDASELGLTPKMYAPETFIPLEPGQDSIGTERLRQTSSSLVGRDPIELAKKQEAADAATKAEQQKELDRQQSIERVAAAQRVADLASERREHERNEQERLQEEKVARYGGYIGLAMFDLYDNYKSAVDHIANAETSEQQSQAISDRDQNIQRAKEMLDPQSRLKKRRETIEQDAIREANAAGHDVNFGNVSYPASK